MAPQQGLLDRIKDEPDNAQVNISPFSPFFFVPHMHYSFRKGSSWLRIVLLMGWEEIFNEGWGNWIIFKNNTKESTRVTGNFFQVVIKASNPLCSLITLFCDFYSISEGLGKVNLQGFEIYSSRHGWSLWRLMSLWCDCLYKVGISLLQLLLMKYVKI